MWADVPSGSLEEARVYYVKITNDLKYSTPDKISDTTLSDLAAYLGYKTLTAEKLEFDPPEKLKANGAAGDVLVSRFFAPKIMNVKFKEDDEKFNEEAHKHAEQAQPKHDESLAAAKWLEIHKTNYVPVPPIKRTIGAAPQWSGDDANEVAVLETMNQYCYRCHGTVKFSVFNKKSLLENRDKFLQRLDPDAEVGLKMPPDRDLPNEKRDLLLRFLKP